MTLPRSGAGFLKMIMRIRKQDALYKKISSTPPSKIRRADLRKLIKNRDAFLEEIPSTPPLPDISVADLRKLIENLDKEIPSTPPLPDISLADLRKLSGPSGIKFRTKKQQRELERRGRQLAQFNRISRQRRRREGKIALALLGGRGNSELARVARETWKRRLRPPVGSLATDRALIAAMWPIEWRSARRIGERIDWSQFGSARSGPSPSRLFGPLKRLIAHGMVEKTVRSRQYFRLTRAGLDLHGAIRIRIVPEWSAMVRVSPRPVGDNPGEQKTLCAMTPGAWQSVGDICLVLGWSRKNGRERRTVDNALGRLVRASAVKRARNPHWEGPGPWVPKNLYQLTALGKRAREGLILIGDVML